MSDKKISLYNKSADLSPEKKGQIAVEAALEVIKAGALGGEGTMDAKFNCLSQFADSIQEALEKTS